MLADKHITAIRAALRYWEEEMAPHGSDVIDAYLAEEAIKKRPCPEDFSNLQQHLANCSIHYVVVNSDLNQIIDGRLHCNPEEIVSDSESTDLVGVLLTFPKEK